VVRRQDEKKELWFFINDGDSPATIEKMPNQGFDLISNQPVGGPLTLEPNEVAVIQTTPEATPGV
jgi:beta-galactosidase GanA